MTEGIEGSGACGINCFTCGLARSGQCSPCGPGDGEQARRKLAVQEELLGGTCPVLACAAGRNIAHCLADCPEFPCPHFEDSPYPFSDGFLNMQLRRRRSAAPRN